MVSKKINIVPEALATLTFLPLGIYMGFITHFFFINQLAIRVLYFTEQWPHLLSAFCAIATGIFLTFGRLRQTQDRYRFDHFYVLMFGMSVVLLGGIILVSTIDTPYTGVYVIFAGKGICYIAALSYLNIRIGKTRYRFIKLSLPHWVYLFGAAIGASVTSISTEFVYTHYSTVIEVEGILIITTAVLLLGGYLGNESLHHQKRINYKQSLDDDINRENDCGEIFVNKYFLIMEPRSEAQAEQMINTKQERHVGIEVFSIILAVLGKIGGVAYFYAPFMFMYYIGELFSENLSMFVINWYGMIAITISIVALRWGPYKLHFLFSCGIKLLVVVLVLVVLAVDDDLESVKILFSFVFAVLAIGYGYCDINILSFANLKYNEIILALGYSVQYIIIGVIQYYTIYHTTLILDFSSSFSLMFAHSITFALFFISVALVATYVLPNRNQLSLLEIKNAIFRKYNASFSVGVSTGNPNNNLPPPYLGQPAYPYQGYGPGTQGRPPQGMMPGTHYPQYYPAPQPYPQQQYYPNHGAPPPNYADVYAGQIPIDQSHMTARSNKITEL